MNLINADHQAWDGNDFRSLGKRHGLQEIPLLGSQPKRDSTLFLHNPCARAALALGRSLMRHPKSLREQASQCRDLMRTATEPEVIEQLRIWVVELAEEADVERRAARLASVQRRKDRQMTAEKRELYSSPNGDRWFLCRDATSGVFIRHEANLPSGGHLTDINISTFLNEGQLHPQHQALLRLIGTLIDCSPRASRLAGEKPCGDRRPMRLGLPRRIRPDSL